MEKKFEVAASFTVRMKAPVEQGAGLTPGEREVMRERIGMVLRDNLSVRFEVDAERAVERATGKEIALFVEVING